MCEALKQNRKHRNNTIITSAVRAVAVCWKKKQILF